MPNRDDVRTLLHHYENLYADTVLLVEYCGQMKLSLRDGFADVCSAIMQLTAQLQEIPA